MKDAGETKKTSAFREVLVLTGPTASGKSALALVLAEQLDAEIISMDSMALYRGMDVGTAKPSRTDRGRIPHHLVDVLAPSESASVAWWLEHAEQCVKDIERRNKRVIVSGGTPLYLKAILFGLFDGPPAQPALRAVLEQLPGSELHARLRSVDPTAAERLHPHDVRRLVRALEVWETTGQPISAWQQQTHEQPILARSAVWLDWPRETLYRRINDRVLGMMDAGLLDELRQLTEQAPPLSKEASQALGYKEMLEHLQGKCDLPTAIQSIQIRSRQFAKRQITWFRHLPQCQPLSVSETETTNELARRVCECWGIA